MFPPCSWVNGPCMSIPQKSSSTICVPSEVREVSVQPLSKPFSLDVVFDSQGMGIWWVQSMVSTPHRGIQEGNVEFEPGSSYEAVWARASAVLFFTIALQSHDMIRLLERDCKENINRFDEGFALFGSSEMRRLSSDFS